MVTNRKIPREVLSPEDYLGVLLNASGDRIEIPGEGRTLYVLLGARDGKWFVVRSFRLHGPWGGGAAPFHWIRGEGWRCTAEVPSFTQGGKLERDLRFTLTEGLSIIHGILNGTISDKLPGIPRRRKSCRKKNCLIR